LPWSPFRQTVPSCSGCPSMEGPSGKPPRAAVRAGQRPARSRDLGGAASVLGSSVGLGFGAGVRVPPLGADPGRPLGDDGPMPEWSPPTECDQCPHPIADHVLWEPDTICGGWMHCRTRPQAPAKIPTIGRSGYAGEIGANVVVMPVIGHRDHADVMAAGGSDDAVRLRMVLGCWTERRVESRWSG
jgi:hypothetical protein